MEMDCKLDVYTDSDSISLASSSGDIKIQTTFNPVMHTKSSYNEDLMLDTKLREIAAALLTNSNSTKTSSKQSKFCVEDFLPSTDIQISIKNVGNLNFPISREIIEHLKSESTKAKFGLGEKTILDESVRNTHVIESTKLDVKINENALSRILKCMKDSLDLPFSSNLKAELHNMLIYGPGQFFNRHRDSEKIPNMVATLVIILPSPHIGGNLVVEHCNTKHVVSTENLNETNAKFACFYSDCWHLVEKIKEGHRIVLTYNIALEDGKLKSTPVDENFVSKVQSYFEDETKESDCLKLIFLLNHSYSQHSLKWPLLKGEDQVAAVKFLDAAKSLDLAIHLALVDISQNWTCGDDVHHYTYEMELNESNHTLTYWVDENNTILPYKNFDPSESEICFTKETYFKTFKPTDKDIQGPTGNEGCTSDYSYQRAAIVMWKRKNSEKISFELNFEAAFANLHNLVKTPGNESKVQYLVKLAKIHLNRGINTKTSFQKFVDIALYVKDENTAISVLSGISALELVNENIPQLLALEKLYGLDFCTKIFKKWLESYRIPSVMPFIENFMKANGDKKILEVILESTISNSTNSWYYTDVNHFDLFKACDVIGNTHFQKIYAKCLVNKNTISKLDLGKIFLDLQKTVPPNSQRFEPLRLAIIEAVKPLIEGIKCKGLWYINECTYCKCEICKPINELLKSNNQSLQILGGKMKCNHINKHFRNHKIVVGLEGPQKKSVITISKKQCVYNNAKDELKKLSELLHKIEDNTISEMEDGRTAAKKQKK